MPPKKCISNCTDKKTLDECNTDSKCAYANGKIRKFCRLSYKYTFDTDCNIISKKTKKITELKTSPSKKQKIIKKSTKKNRTITSRKRVSTEPKMVSSRTRKANKLISNLILKKRHKIRANFLNTICSDAGYCITLGKEEKKINSFFDGFINFKYAISPVTSIGKVSANGFIKEIIFEREGYKCYTVLKSQNDNTTDSLIYEYFVGQYINTLTTKLPLFLKTYGLLKYNNHIDHNISKDNSNLDISQFKRLLKPVLNIDDTITDFSYLCNSESSLNCILIEHLKNPIYIYDICNLGKKNKLTPIEMYNLEFELPNIFFQLYFGLSSIFLNFTHYDLHHNNVLLYKPQEFGYLTYHYYTSGKEKPITFNSQYIVKIIDYGRCFYKYNEDRNSDTFYTKLCNAASCQPRCGERYGHSFLGLNTPKKDYYINIRKKNASHDLRFANIIKSKIDGSWIKAYKTQNKEFLKILKKVYYAGEYGTPENLNITYYTNPKEIKQITNVIQLKNALDNLMNKKLSTSNFLTMDPHYTKLGDLHIYDDGRPMRYEPVK
jgi:hypothetical protein